MSNTDKAEHWAEIMRGDNATVLIKPTADSPTDDDPLNSKPVTLRASITKRFDDHLKGAEHALAKAEAELARARDTTDLDEKEKSEQAALAPIAEQIYNQEKVISKLQGKIDKLKKSKQKHKDNLEFIQRERDKRAVRVASLSDHRGKCLKNIEDARHSRDRSLAEVPPMILGELLRSTQYSLNYYAKCGGKMPLHLPYKYFPKTETLLLFSPFTKDIHERFVAQKLDETEADNVTRLFVSWFWTIMAELEVERGDVTPRFVPFNSVEALYLHVKVRNEIVKKVVEKGARLLVGGGEEAVERPLAKVEKVAREMGKSTDVPDGVDFSGMFTFSELNDDVWKEVETYFI